MEYTFYRADGTWLGHVGYSGVAPVLEEGQQIVSGTYPENTMLVDGEVVAATGVALDEYNNKLLMQIRRERNVLLSQSDWTQSPDSPLSDAKKQEWATYRQVLRDLPANTTDPANPTWPTQPT